MRRVVVLPNRSGWPTPKRLSQIKADPLDTRLRIEAGQNLAAMNRFAEAMAQFAETVRIQPGLAEAHVLYGAALGQQGRTSDAVAQFREALRLNPSLQEARLNLGIALLNQGLPSDALAELEQISAVNPNHAQATQMANAIRARLAPPVMFR
ncbi:MAG TPA: tetratricopeptide repeat protein [Verrucomicrobiae bacterium]|nr:tetratricopeptide repeat protein [Verrucomicrobiae bacterium]